MGDVRSLPMDDPAHAYEAYFVTNQLLHWADDLLNRVHFRGDERILDVGCGTGIVARRAAKGLRDKAQVAGVDPNPAMLAVARSVASREGVAVSWHQEAAESLSFLNASFDLVVMQQSLQYVQDQDAALAETHRVLVPGGRVVSSTWTAIEQNPVHQLLAGAIERCLKTPTVQAQFGLGDRAMLERLFLTAGFEEITITVVRREDHLPSPDQFVAFALAGAVAAMPAMQDIDHQARERLVDTIRDEIRVPLERHIEDGFVITPMETHIVSACKAYKNGR